MKYHNNHQMFHITESDLFNYINNPTRLTLHICNGVRCSSTPEHTGTVMSFDELSKNEIIQELYIVNIDFNIDAYSSDELDDIYGKNNASDYFVFPVNLKKLILPNSFNDFYNVVNHCVNGQLHMPTNLEELVIYNMSCLESIKLNDKIQHIVVKCAILYYYIRENESFYHNVFNTFMSLKSVKLYESAPIQEVEQMVKKMKLPYECTHIVSADEYVE